MGRAPGAGLVYLASMTRTHGLIVASCLLLVLIASAARGDEDVLIDEDYRFRLERPGPGWRLMDEDAIVELVPDAVAGAMKPNGVAGVIIVEAAPDIVVEDFARFVLDNMPLEQPEIHEFGKIRYLDKDAVCYQVSGTLSGIRLVYRSVVFAHQGYAFQVHAWVTEFRANQAELELFAKAFSLLPGKITGRSATRVVEDVQGVGWRVKDGVFESAVYGIAVEPRGNWRLAIGAELAQMNPDAEVCLVHAAPEGFVAVVAEQAAGCDKKAFADMVRASGLLEMGAVEDGKPAEIEILGRTVRMHRYVVRGSPAIVFHKSAFFVGDVCFQVVAWHIRGLEKQLEPVLPQALASIRLLDDAERRELVAALRHAPDPQVSVGQGYALRGGLYRSFEFGFTWKAPDGWWRLTAGHEARQENPDASLILESPETGVNGVVIAEGAYGFTAEDYHDVVVAGVYGDEASAPKEPPRLVQLGEAQGRHTKGALDADGTDFVFHVVTTVHQGRALQLLLYGAAGNMRTATDVIEGAIGGLRVHPEIKPIVKVGNTIQDWRLGFSMRTPGLGWRHTEATPGAMRSIASMHTWKRGRSEVVALGIGALREEQDSAWFEKFVAGLLEQKLGTLGAGDATRSEGRLAGLEATRLEWNLPSRTMVAYLLSRGSAFHALLLNLAPGSGTTEEKVVAGFDLLD
jgi:hypothetical protein